MTFTITIATKGGFFVTAQRNPEVLFAGTLEQCLAFIRDQFEPSRPAREL